MSVKRPAIALLVAASMLLPATAKADVIGGQGDTLTGAGLRWAQSNGANTSGGGGAPRPGQAQPGQGTTGAGRALPPWVCRNPAFPGMKCMRFVTPSNGPSTPTAASPPAPPTPAQAAVQAWQWQTKLPSPSLATSPPDGAITGLDLYLAIGGPQMLALDVPALGYVIHFDVTSLYDVDWGDPRPDGSPTGQAITRGHPNQGGPYPTGDLRHQYIQRGSATIQVTQRWTAHWTGGGDSGTITDRLSTTAAVTIPVHEIQAALVP
jgi:hypothetical protein